MPENPYKLDNQKELKKVDGIIRVPLQNGDFEEFKDYKNSFESRATFEYIGEIKGLDIAVLHVSYYEWGNNIFVDRNNGRIYDSWYSPQLSPGAKRICCISSGGYDGDPVGIQIWEVEESNDYRLQKIVELDMVQVAPQEFYWVNDSILHIKAEDYPLIGRESREELREEVFFKVQINGWF